ncbi:KUP/HAK/KT family potassium transporter [Sphingomonas bacterium]|uniref:KUP/HAK/KT family potassium transporter n=1 Tax=Sphingomonas bacterium TaxID=1895847 RepID=UPI003F68A3A9
MPIELFLTSTAKVHRVPATAIYLTTVRDGVPPALLHNLKANQVRHARILFVTVETALTPYVAAAERLSEAVLGDGVSRIVIRYGFFENPDIPAALREVEGTERATYFLSRQTLVPTRKPGMARWREHLFSAMVRNAEQPMTFFCLPINRVVELGSQVEI